MEYGSGKQDLIMQPMIEKMVIYKIFCLLVETILKSNINKIIEIYASIKLKGIVNIETNPSFSVVNAVQTFCKIYMCKNLH